jgi:hypothetical protein
MEIKNKGVEILLSRMESNPEEFELGYYGKNKRWDWVLKAVLSRIERKHKSTADHPLDLPYLSDVEIDALYQKYMSIQGDSFTKRVMGELLNEGERTLEYNHPYNTNDSDQRKKTQLRSLEIANLKVGAELRNSITKAFK